MNENEDYSAENPCDDIDCLWCN